MISVQPLRIPVVGVGSSAGGIKALSELLGHLGAAPGVSVVIVQHLSPDRESTLPELLRRATPLPVAVPQDGQMLEVDHVYVVPPAAALVVHSGQLRLIPRPPDGGVQHPIDRLFHSLAAEQGPLAACVVLSGTGTDGSIGIKAVKAAGGIIFAQDASAEFSGMPNAAIATGCVDFVRSPQGIAEELRRLGANPSALLYQPETEKEVDFRKILEVLHKAGSIDFTGYKEATIRRRLQRRAFLKQMGRLSDYLALLEQDPKESKALAAEMLIHVTGFFRDAAVFEALKVSVLPKLLERRAADATLRVWVPGCSTGEEVYSIAICILELLSHAGKTDIQVKLFGTDASEAAIDSARSGRYSEGIERDVSPERLQTFFEHVGGMFRVKPQLRELCVFARHDAMRDPPFSHMDLISCRNLMIYLTPTLQDRLLPTLHYALNEVGFLVLGRTETTRDFPGFAAFDLENRIYTRVPTSTRARFEPLMPSLPDPSLRARSKQFSPSDILREADRVVLAEVAPAGVVVTDDLTIIQFRGKTGRYLEPAPGAARFELLRMAREELRLPLRQALDKARTTGNIARALGVSVHTPPELLLDLEVIPFGAHPAPEFFVVLFRELSTTTAAATGGAGTTPALPAEEHLQKQLDSTREYLQNTIEQLEDKNELLRAANQEVTSSNEELRSTNEELQVAKEELQASNQELVTVNNEIVSRSQEVDRLNSDLTNLLKTVGVPVVLLDREARIRRFTMAAEKLFDLTMSDLGRPIGELRRPFTLECGQLAKEVIGDLRSVERGVQDNSGNWHLFVARPYLTADQVVDGTIITVFDINAVTGASFREILTGATEAIVMVEPNGRIAFANPAAAQLFGYGPAELLGLAVETLVPEAERARHVEHRDKYLSESSPRPMGRDREVLGVRRDGRSFPIEVVLNPTRSAHGTLVVAFITDVSKRRETELEIRSYQERLQHMAFEAAVAEERERRRIAVNLHDHVGQTLALARIKLSSVRENASGVVRQAIDDSVELIAQSLKEARNLTFDLSPPILYDLGLKEALAWLVDDVKERYGIAVDLRIDQEPTPLDEASAALVFRAVRELLFNVFKHARASTASMLVRRVDDHLEIEVADQGVGFEPAKGPHAQRGFGLFSVREQLARLGGSLEIESAPQRGTRVSVRVPLGASPNAQPA